MEVRTRFAPSPTGYMHIGNLRSALYAYLFARKNGGKFLLRIEDTDQERLVEGAVDIIYNTLKEVGMTWDEGPDIGGPYGPYVQTERRDLYLPLAKQLVESGHAYYCFCTKEELDGRREAAAKEGRAFKYDKHCLHLSKEEIQQKLDAGVPYVIRQNVPESGTTSFTDELFDTITVENNTLDDNVLIKADGLPTYNFANVVDDHLMHITHVMRGMEYLSSTPKYNLLYQAFGWEIPAYIHMPPIMKDAQNKLSKRNGDASYNDLREKGYLKEAILNYIALLGWNPGTNQEKFSLEELIQAFSIKGMSKSPAIFDPLKLKWLNGEYIRALSEEEFLQNARPWFAQAGVSGMDEALLARLLQPRVETFGEIPEKVEFLTKRLPYAPELFQNKKNKVTPEVCAELLDVTIAALEALPEWNEAALHDALMGLVERTGKKTGTVFWPARVGLSALAVTPGGPIEIACLLGKEESLVRLHAAKDYAAALTA